MSKEPSMGVMVTKCKMGYVLTDESSPAVTNYAACSTLEEVLPTLALMFGVELKGALMFRVELKGETK